MKILFLGKGDLSKDLCAWLKDNEDGVVYTENKIDLDTLEKASPDFIISYNYHFILPQEIISRLCRKVINLHISYLPWNRGTYPNVWSFIENTPKGVSILYMDEGIDTGELIAQKEFYFSENDEETATLKSTYLKLHEGLQLLFKENWNNFEENKIISIKQQGKGSIHNDADFTLFIKPIVEKKGWDISIRNFKEEYNQLYKKVSHMKRY